MKYIISFESFSQEFTDPNSYSNIAAPTIGFDLINVSSTKEPEVVFSKLKKKSKKIKDTILGDSEYDSIDDEYPWNDNSWSWT